jgi:hypothetical protein
VVDVEALQRENAQLREQLARVVESNQMLAEQIAKLNDRVTELLAVAKRRQRKPAVEKPPIAPPEVSNEDKRSFEQRPKPPPKPIAPERPKTRVKPTGRKPVPSHLEAEEHALRPDACERYGSTALDAASIASGRVCLMRRLARHQLLG